MFIVLFLKRRRRDDQGNIMYKDILMYRLPVAYESHMCIVNLVNCIA